MAYSLLVIDNFYSNPDSVRQFALSQSFDVVGNFPGKRTKPFLNDDTKEWISHHMHATSGKILWPPEEENLYCGAFQFTTAQDRTWIHSDGFNGWAGVLYLTPNAPLTSGTATFRHKETGLTRSPSNPQEVDKIRKDGYDITKWEIVDSISNVYNRLVLYDAKLFHASRDYFGQNINNGRLFQTFFFNTER